jgi:hypothetical protein
VQDGPIVQMMYVYTGGDWQLRMRSLRIAPSFRDSSVAVQGCREKAEVHDSVLELYCLLGCYLRQGAQQRLIKLHLSNEELMLCQAVDEHSTSWQIL